MDFARPHTRKESVATRSKIRHIPVNSENPSLDDRLVQAANQAASELLLGNRAKEDSTALVDASLYPERTTPQTETIQFGQLVVIFESFDNLDFCYAEPGAIFSNRNGHFHHDDFVGKPYGCKIRSRNNRGYGFVYLLKPTPELWARSLNHRTQIVHELDASMIVFYLNLRPNMVVCESGTGSGALSHCILRTIAPQGHLYTYEFNEMRAETARKEFAKNRVDSLVTVQHKDVCGKKDQGGFGRPQASVDAIILDLPEPWQAVPHAAHCLKPNARIASYSPCVEQSQRTISAMEQAGFHSVKTMEFRLKEHYVDEVEYELAPREKRQRLPSSDRPHWASGKSPPSEQDDNADKPEETQASTKKGTDEKGEVKGDTPVEEAKVLPVTNNSDTSGTKRKVLVARPFAMMRGHTAFLTFATAGNLPQPDPNVK